MAGCVYHCIAAVSHDMSNSYKSTLSLFDSKCFVAILYFFPPYFKSLSHVVVIYEHLNSSTVRRLRRVRGTRRSLTAGAGVGKARGAGRCAASSGCPG